MVGTVLFLLVSLRAVIELVVWVMIGRLILRLLAGRAAMDNAVLRLFDGFLRPPRALVQRLLPRVSIAWRDGLLFLLLLSLWLSLGVGKWWLLT